MKYPAIVILPLSSYIPLSLFVAIRDIPVWPHNNGRKGSVVRQLQIQRKNKDDGGSQLWLSGSGRSEVVGVDLEEAGKHVNVGAGEDSSTGKIRLRIRSAESRADIQQTAEFPCLRNRSALSEEIYPKTLSTKWVHNTSQPKKWKRFFVAIYNIGGGRTPRGKESFSRCNIVHLSTLGYVLFQIHVSSTPRSNRCGMTPCIFDVSSPIAY